MIYSIKIILKLAFKKTVCSKKYSLVYSKGAKYCMGHNAYIVIVREIMGFKHTKNSSQMLNSFEKRKKKKKK